MTEKDSFHVNFVETLKRIYPERGKAASVLVDLLCIEKEAAYRRLRGEVPFSFDEVAKIAKKLSLSLDSIIGASSLKSRPFQLKLTDYYNPDEVDCKMHEEYIDFISIARANSEYSEMGFATSTIPLNFIVKFEQIYRFYILHGLYQFGTSGSVVPFSEIIVEDRIKSLNRRYIMEVENVKSTYFIWDELLLFYIANDIKYFNSVRLITTDEVQILKQELLDFLDYVELLTIKGSFNNNNKVQMYVSSLNFETTYSYLQTDSHCLTLIRAFTMNELVSLDEEVFNKLKTWMEALKRTSVLISESNERNRILFFEKQRKFIAEKL